MHEPDFQLPKTTQLLHGETHVNGISGETAGCDPRMIEEMIGHSDPYIANVAFVSRGEASYP